MRLGSRSSSTVPTRAAPLITSLDYARFSAVALRDINDRRLYVLPGQEVPALLQLLTGGAVNASHVEEHWDELSRMATSIRTGTVAASAMLKRLAVYPRQNGLEVALREVCHIERTLFALS